MATKSPVAPTAKPVTEPTASQKSNKPCDNWLPTGTVGKGVIALHFVIAVCLFVGIIMNYTKIKNNYALTGGLISVVISAIIGYYILYALLMCGCLGGRVIVGVNVLLNVLFIIGMVMYLATATTTSPAPTTSATV